MDYSRWDGLDVSSDEEREGEEERQQDTGHPAEPPNAQQLRQPASSEPTPEVIISGPDGPRKETTICETWMGKYGLDPDLVVNGRPAYRHTDEPERCLWSSSGALWLLGWEEDLGRACAVAYVADGAALPDAASAQWRCFDRGARKFVDSQLRCRDAAVVAAELAERAERTVYLVGSSLCCHRLLGIYVRSDAPAVGGLPTYEQAPSSACNGEPSCMW